MDNLIIAKNVFNVFIPLFHEYFSFYCSNIHNPIFNSFLSPDIILVTNLMIKTENILKTQHSTKDANQIKQLCFDIAAVLDRINERISIIKITYGIS